MARNLQFDSKPHGRSPLCLTCEDMLADALDHTLSPADQTWFDTHIATCSDCAALLADAQRGAAWLELLKSPRPEPSAALMDRIIAQTSDAAPILAPILPPILAPVIVGQPSNVLSFRPRLPQIARWTSSRFEPRLAMTAAMAFFSIALTLNLTGVRLDHFNARSLKPANFRHTYYEASAGAVRYYDNLSFVRDLESRIEDVRQSDAQPTPNAAPDAAPDSTPAPAQTPDQPQDDKLNPRSKSNPKSKPTPKASGPISRRETHQEGGLV